MESLKARNDIGKVNKEKLKAISSMVLPWKNEFK